MNEGAVPERRHKAIRVMEKIRIRFAADLVIEGETMAEVKDKWNGLPLFTDEAIACGVDFLEIEAVEDADTNEDRETEFINAFVC